MNSKVESFIAFLKSQSDLQNIMFETHRQKQGFFAKACLVLHWKNNEKNRRKMFDLIRKNRSVRAVLAEICPVQNGSLSINYQDIFLMQQQPFIGSSVSTPEALNKIGKQEISMTSNALETTNDSYANSSADKITPKNNKKGFEKTSKQLECVVCNKKTRCKYNILRSGDTKHLCDDVCFKAFKSNPASYLTPSTTPDVGNGKKTPKNQSENTQKSNDSCDHCLKALTGSNKEITWKVGRGFKTFCSQLCFEEGKVRLKTCTSCGKNILEDKNAFSAPLVDEGFKDFCSHKCLTKYETFKKSSNKEILSNAKTESSTLMNGTSNLVKCYQCNALSVCKFEIMKNKQLRRFCSDGCVAAFNSLEDKCEMCKSVLKLMSKKFSRKLEGVNYKMCSVTCLNTFMAKHHKLVPCFWCNVRKGCFDMIERQDPDTNAFQMFCSLNCLSLYQVNLQANSNMMVKCDQCMTPSPAQYHLSMSDASVRNFCGYPCVMAFQSKYVQQPQQQQQQSSSSSSTTTTTTTQSTTTSTTNNDLMSNESVAPDSDILQNKTHFKNLALSDGVNDDESFYKVIIKPPAPKEVKNKSLICKPLVHTKFTQCKTHLVTKETQTDENWEPKKIIIPVPVPIMLPAPMNMYTTPSPHPIILPVPVPVPCFIPTTKNSAAAIMKKIKDLQDKLPSDPYQAELLMMAEAVAGVNKSSDNEQDNDDAEDATHGEEDMLTIALRMASEMVREDDNKQLIRSQGIAGNAYSTIDTSSDILQHNMMSNVGSGDDGRVRGIKRKSTGAGQKGRTNDNGNINIGNNVMMNANNNLKSPANQNSVKKYKLESTATSFQQQQLFQSHNQPQTQQAEVTSDATYILKFTYGVNAYKHWVMQKNTQIESAYQQYQASHKTPPSLARGPRLFKSDLLQAPSVELNQALSMFVKEVRKPNGEDYAPDSILYLCLGIQEYLYENGRIDNIFTDFFYEKFNDNLNEILSHYEVRLNAQGMLVCRIEEEHLWESKQLGAHSPHVLLNTLLYFNSKHFLLKSPQDHIGLSFSNIVKHWKKVSNASGKQSKSVYLRYYLNPPAPTASSNANEKKKAKEDVTYLEQAENAENPLRCPVKLYEFYISKCPESIKNRNDMFYLTPERSCVPDSPVWYSTQPHHIDNITKMFNRLRVVREVQEAHLSNMAPTYYA